MTIDCLHRPLSCCFMRTILQFDRWPRHRPFHDLFLHALVASQVRGFRANFQGLSCRAWNEVSNAALAAAIGEVSPTEFFETAGLSRGGLKGEVKYTVELSATFPGLHRNGNDVFECEEPRCA